MSSIATIRTKNSNEIAFANLTEQVQRKFFERPFHFTLMLVGECGSAQTTLIENLFQQKLEENLSSFSSQFEISTLNIEEFGFRIRLRVVRTRNFGNSIDDRHWSKTLVEFLDKQFEDYFHDEYGFQRQTIVDRRVHCLFYLISSLSRGFKPLDIQCIRALKNKVNVIPILVKADALTNEERIHLKRTILDQIGFYHLPIYRNVTRTFPFAIVTSKSHSTRVYPWGQVDVHNEEISDLNELRRFFITQMYDLQQMTHHFHYEEFRLKKLRRRENGF